MAANMAQSSLDIQSEGGRDFVSFIFVQMSRTLQMWKSDRENDGKQFINKKRQNQQKIINKLMFSLWSLCKYASFLEMHHAFSAFLNFQLLSGQVGVN